jgi:protein involved in polysaccharide export with SLBB domain
MANALTHHLRGLFLLAGVVACASASAQMLPSTLPIPATTAVTPAPMPAQAVPSTTAPAPALPSSTAPTSAPPAVPAPMTSTGGLGPLPTQAWINPLPPVRLPVFGSQLFSGRFAAVTYSGFNAGYQLAIGDMVSVRLWGAVSYDALQAVDAQGNLFIPSVGPVHVQGVKNGDLTTQVESQVKKTYRANVGVYATLVTAQPVKVYVTGYVRAPGLYPGLSSDSVLYYLDRAGGIDTVSGSYLQVEVLRGNESRLKVDLYKFLSTGRIDEMQLRDGDTIVVGPRKNTILVYGNVTNPYQYELRDRTVKASELMGLAHPLPGSTHLSVVRAVGLERRSYYYPIGQIADITLEAGDELTITADQYPTSVLVHVSGAQMGEHNFVLPLGARIKDLMPRLTPSPTADLNSIQLFRPTVAAKQKESLDNTLNALQNAALTARNSTLTEAQARQTESTMILQFIDRARTAVPKGQVIMASKGEVDDTLLQDGDTVVIPERTNLVAVSGEVQLPNTLVWQQGRETIDYVALVGGYTQRADRSRVLVMRQNGAVAPHGANPEPGDEIMVLPVIETKYIEVASGITSILYQLAISAKVLTGL